MKIAEILFKSGATKEIKCEDGECSLDQQTGQLKRIKLINAEGYGCINIKDVDCVLFKEVK